LIAWWGRLGMGRDRWKLQQGRLELGGGRLAAQWGRWKLGGGRLKLGRGSLKLQQGWLIAWWGRLGMGRDRWKLSRDRWKLQQGRLELGGGRLELRGGAGCKPAVFCRYIRVVWNLQFSLNQRFGAPLVQCEKLQKFDKAPDLYGVMVANLPRPK
jgi:hypothetical protein